jgi:hypothetical protein
MDSDEPLATKLHQRKFLSEMALGVIDKLLALEKPWEQLREVRSCLKFKHVNFVSEHVCFSGKKFGSEITSSK